MKTGAELIAEERGRQLIPKSSGGEGWTHEHDAGHASGELCDAAVSYAKAASLQARGESLEMLKTLAGACRVPWPWEDCWWKPSADPVRNLVKAGALISAEIDRLLKVAPSGQAELVQAALSHQAGYEAGREAGRKERERGRTEVASLKLPCSAGFVGRMMKLLSRQFKDGLRCEQRGDVLVFFLA